MPELYFFQTHCQWSRWRCLQCEWTTRLGIIVCLILLCNALVTITLQLIITLQLQSMSLKTLSRPWLLHITSHDLFKQDLLVLHILRCYCKLHTCFPAVNKWEATVRKYVVSLPMVHGKQACGIPLLLQYQLGNSPELVPSPTLTHGTARLVAYIWFCSQQLRGNNPGLVV